jgi:hypothetical protein
VQEGAMIQMADLTRQGMDGFRQAGERLAAWRAEVARRAALARQPQPEGARPPSVRRLIAELGSPAELWREAGKVRRAGGLELPRGTSRAVMLVPGFGAHPMRMRGWRVRWKAPGTASAIGAWAGTLVRTRTASRACANGSTRWRARNANR